MAEQLLRACKRASNGHEIKRSFPNPRDQIHQSKKPRKGENPVRIPQCDSADYKSSTSWICKNAACRASLSADDAFCKRCSCCICHLFDDNKDPSLWLECTSELGVGHSCGLSCHIECALRHGKAGMVEVGSLAQLDGSYCCSSCGNVSGILGCLRKQLIVAKDARRVDVLCHRILLSYKLLLGTSRFSDIHEILSEAKAKLEAEVGPLDGVSANLARGIVSRLSAAVDVQRLCSVAIERTDELMASNAKPTNSFKEGSLPAACKFLFQEVTSSSVVIVLIDLSSTSLDEDIKGYKLWYCKTKEETYTKEPSCIFPRNQRRIWIYNLQPCTEYSFRIVSYSESGDFGHSEVKCFTKSVEVINKNSHFLAAENVCTSYVGTSSSNHQKGTSSDIELDSGFKVRELGNILRLLMNKQQCCSDSCSSADVMKHFFNSCSKVKQEAREEKKPSVSRALDLNVASVPDLNEEFTPPIDSIGDEGNNNVHVTYREVQDSDSTLTNGSPFTETGCLDENFDYCVKIIRWMECEGHISRDFRLKLLTWFSLRSTEQERRVVNTFIQSLIDDPVCLAGQLMDTFSDIVSSKRARNGLCR